MFQVVDLIREEPSLKAYVLERVERTFHDRNPSGLDDQQIPRELTELIAHEFRWPELVDLAHERVNRFWNGDWSFSRGDVSGSVVDAMTDDWEDREFYDRYR